MNMSCFLSPWTLIANWKNTKYYFIPGLILDFIIYKSCKGFLNAYISAE